MHPLVTEETATFARRLKMPNNLIRPGSIVLLIGLALLGWGLVSKTDVNARQGEQHIEIESFSWGISQSQLLRICISHTGRPARSSSSTRESVAFYFNQIKTQAGEELLVKELRVPSGEFRCLDFSHAELVAAGFIPEANSRLQFMVNITSPEQSDSATVGAAQQITVGAAQSISVDSGKTETYMPFRTNQTRQITLIQDL